MNCPVVSPFLPPPRSNSFSELFHYLPCFALHRSLDRPRLWLGAVEDTTASGVLGSTLSHRSVVGRKLHLVLLVSNENCVGNCMLALSPKGSQSNVGSSSCVMEGYPP